MTTYRIDDHWGQVALIDNEDGHAYPLVKLRRNGQGMMSGDAKDASVVLHKVIEFMIEDQRALAGTAMDEDGPRYRLDGNYCEPAKHVNPDHPEDGQEPNQDIGEWGHWYLSDIANCGGVCTDYDGQWIVIDGKIIDVDELNDLLGEEGGEAHW